MKSAVAKVIETREPGRFVYAPNYWQWFAHHQNHGTLPGEVQHCKDQLDLIEYLGLDIFSRNIYSNQGEYWFGGICREYLEEGEITTSSTIRNGDRFTKREYHLKRGTLTEELQYVFDESTVVQKKFLVDDYHTQFPLLEELVMNRRWEFRQDRYAAIRDRVGNDGMVVVGDFFSPLKMLHLVMGPIQTVYFLMEQPGLARGLITGHEAQQLELVKQAMERGARVIMAMDNLDTMFHPPDYVRQYSASFYEKASAICNKAGGRFFIHACGNQKENLKLISSLGVDGLEGVAYPPLGNVELHEALEMTSDKFIITGGISAMETGKLKTSREVFSYVKELFASLKPYRNRFIFSASCNTAVDTPWETIKLFRDAWLEYRNL